ncbi:MAG: hypothetical protein HXX19_13760 [Rhodoferax sp.]|nr:hypothetical protein [Rhodoferax sp.]
MTEYTGLDRRAEQWHLDKKVPLGLIFAMLAQGAAVMMFIGDIKKDVEVLKAQVSSQRDRDDHQDKAYSEAVQTLRQQLERMESKLDRLAERAKQ